MQQHWITLLSGLRDVATKLSSEIPAQLEWSDWHADDAEQLWFVLGQLCSKSEAATELIKDQGADDTLIEAGEALQQVFLTLQSAVGERAIALGSVLRPNALAN